MIFSMSGCISGSPPLIMIAVVPRSASLSNRWNITSVGTGFEKSSYSLQYAQAKLHRRIGMMCAKMGWSVDHSPLAMKMNSRE